MNDPAPAPIPGTTLFDGRMAQRGYALNAMCYSFNQAENRQACLFYESRGFAKAGETDVFHAWLPDGPAEQTQERRSRP